MKIKTTKTISLGYSTFQKVSIINSFYLKRLSVSIGSAKDIDSVNLEIYYNEIPFAYGHINNRTNFAHVYFYDDFNLDLETCIVEAIENRTVSFI